MGLRKSYRPLRPDLDGFLFAALEMERDGIPPLSMISALTRLGLDPWEEAGRLSAVNRGEATEQLARLIAELPGNCRPLAEAREIAGDLIERLPEHGSAPTAPARPRRPALPRQLKQRWFWLCLALAAAVAIGVILSGGFPFGGGRP